MKKNTAIVMVIILSIVFLLSGLYRRCSAQSLRREEAAKMFGYISLLMSPALIAAPHVDSDDRIGKATYYTYAAISVGTGIASLCLSDHRKSAHYSSFFIAGMLDGFNEELTHHYLQVKEQFPCMHDEWWDPAISWKNKYTAKWPFAKTLFVGPTDAYHSTRTLNKIFVIGGIFTFDKEKGLKKNILKALKISAFYSGGKFLVHNYFAK
ncbi:MAG: hypothetical protein ACHQ1D_00110 [Nitrososphaerales archaeon]